jgi:hypothetical protein
MVAEGLLDSDAWTRFEVVCQNLTVRSVYQGHSSPESRAEAVMQSPLRNPVGPLLDLAPIRNIVDSS